VRSLSFWLLIMKSPELFDVVELLVNLPEQGLQVGAQGAIVEQYADQSFEVEFTNGEGEAIELVVLPVAQFVVVWRSASRTWVPDWHLEEMQRRVDSQGDVARSSWDDVKQRLMGKYSE
jgi:Domain of unknown function (DUF4926)